MKMTKKQKKKVGIISLILVLAVAIGAISLFAFRGGVDDKMTQYGEFSNKTVFPQGSSYITDDGVIRLKGGANNKVDIVLNAPAEGIYRLYFDNHVLTAGDNPVVFVSSSAWNNGNSFVSNVEKGDKHDSQGYSEYGFTVYLNEGRNVISVWLHSNMEMQLNNLKYKLYTAMDTDVKIDDINYINGYSGNNPYGSLSGCDTYLMRPGDKVTSTFKVVDDGVYTVGAFAMYNDGDSGLSIKIIDDTGRVVGSINTDELKEYTLIKRQNEASTSCTFLDFGEDFEVELDVGTYTLEVTTTNWLTWSGAVLDRVGSLPSED